MAFKIQDLLITDLSSEVACGKATGDCTKMSGPPRVNVWACTKTTPPCNGHSGTLALLTTLTTLTFLTCTPFLGRRPEESAEQVALLKAQLNEALAEIDREEKSTAEQFKPKTVEEAEKLEQKLQQALDQVKQERLKLAEK